jgi:hypothetical protein
MSTLDLVDVIDSLGTGDIVIERERAAAFSGGNATAGADDILKVRAVAHHATSRDLMRLPENDRVKETIVIFTDTELRVSSVARGMRGDVVRYGGSRYEVIRREDWEVQAGHFRCYASRLEDER